MENEEKTTNTGISDETRILHLTELLCDKLERAIDELDDLVSTVTIKEKTVEYDEEGKKAVFERTVEREEISVEKGPVDRNALKLLISSLKELRGRECDDRENEGVLVLMNEQAKEYSV